MYHQNSFKVLTSGCFHILHPGHVELFEYASKFGKLIVGINTDEYLLKKSGVVKIPLMERIYMIRSIKYVDLVVPFSEENACDLIKRIRPDIFIKGPDYRGLNIPEKITCEELSIKYLIPPQKKKFNSSDLIT